MRASPHVPQATLKAITVQQPWAWAIFHGKNVENRSSPWRYRGPLLIHAGQRWSSRGETDRRIIDAAVAAGTHAEGAPHPQLQPGVLLGLVDLVNIHFAAGCCAPWGESTYDAPYGSKVKAVYHLVLENPQPFDEPLPWPTGLLGVWNVPADLEAVVRELVPA